MISLGEKKFSCVPVSYTQTILRPFAEMGSRHGMCAFISLAHFLHFSFYFAGRECTQIPGNDFATFQPGCGLNYPAKEPQE